MSEKLNTFIVYFLASIVLYFIFSSLLFAFRNPHLTDTQRILYIKDSLLLRTISPEEVND